MLALIGRLQRRLRERFSLRTQLAIGVGLAVLLTTVAVTTISVALVRRDMKQSISVQQTALMQQTVESLDQKLSQRRSAVQLLAEHLPATGLADPHALQRFLAERPELRIWFDNLLVVRADGTILANVNDPDSRANFNLAQRPYLRQTVATRRALVSAPFRSAISQRAVVLLTNPVFDSAGQVVAVLIGTIDLDRQTLFGSINTGHVGGSGYFYVTTMDGIFVAHPQRERLLQSVRVVADPDGALRQALDGFEGTLEARDGAGVDALLSFKRMQTTGWIVAAVLPAAEAFAPIAQTEQRALLIALLLAGLAAPLAWWLAGRQLRPLDQLSARFDAVRKDPTLVAIAQPYANDQLGRMAQSFDRLMRDRLFAETRYQSSAEELRAATNSFLDAFYVLQAERDSDGRIIDFRFRYVNQNGARLISLHADEIVGQRLCELLPINRSGGFFDRYVEVMRSGQPLQEEFAIDTPGVQASWLAHQVTPLADGVAITTRDISQKKRDEIERNENRAFLQSLVDNLPVLVFSKSVAAEGFGRFVLWNKAAEQVTGLRSVDVVGKSNHDLYSPEEALAYEEHDRSIMASGMPIEVKVHSFTRHDGAARTLHTRTVPLRDSAGQVAHVLGISEDITERRAQERELIRKQAELTAVNDASPLGLLRTNPAGHCTYVNRTFETIAGMRYRDAMGLGWLQAIHPDDAERVLAQWTALPEAARTYRSHHRLLRGSGETVWVSLQSAPILVDDKVMGYVGSVEDVTERRAALAALEFSEQRLRLVADNLPALVAYIDRDERYQFCNAYYQLTQNIEPSNMIGKSIRELFGYRWYQYLAPHIAAALSGEHQSFEREAMTPQGLRNFHYEYIPDRRSDGEVTGFYSMVTDITARKAMEHDLLAQRERLRVTLNSIGDAVITSDMAGLITYINPVAERMTGWSMREALGQPLGEVFQTVQTQDGVAVPDPVSMVIASGTYSSTPGGIMLVARDGRQVAIEDSAAPIRDATQHMIGVVMVFHDVSQAHVMAEKMSHLAAHDALTGLVNRREFERRLELAIVSAAATGKQHSVLYLDLDQFKVVNDTCGHVAGDELLRQLTAVLLERLRQSDLLARLGGDEFGVLLESCGTEPALRIADLLRKTIGEFHFVWEDKVFPIGVSIGLVTFSDGGITMPDVLRMADSACYVAKDKGRNRVHVYTEENAELVARHGQMGWIARIHHALDGDRFVLYFQPIQALDAARHGPHYELLLRMLGEDGELIAPMAFIPAAERYGLMPLLDRWVIRHALASHAPRHPPGAPAGTCAINLSGTSIGDESFLPFVLQQFAESGVPPSEICFEITETAAIANLGQASALIRELKAIGCKFSLDDFGSGMSSFTYLKHLPVDYLKIDGSFVKDMIDDPIDRAMVESINHIGHVMGLHTIAEFVESPAIMVALREIGVDYAQGYAIGRPQPC